MTPCTDLQRVVAAAHVLAVDKHIGHGALAGALFERLLDLGAGLCNRSRAGQSPPGPPRPGESQPGRWPPPGQRARPGRTADQATRGPDTGLQTGRPAGRSQGRFLRLGR